MAAKEISYPNNWKAMERSFRDTESISVRFEAVKIDLDKAFFEIILVGLLKKITKYKLILTSQNGQLLIPRPLVIALIDMGC